MPPIRLLLVDTHPFFLSYLSDFIRQQDDFIVVAETTEGGEALSLMHSFQPQVGVIDMGTPGMTGMDTLARLREANPVLGIVAISLVTAFVYRDAALEAGADEFVPKAKIAEELLPAIQRVFNLAEKRAQRT